MLLPTFAGQLFLASCFFSLALRREVSEEEANRMAADYSDCTTPFLRNFGLTCFCPLEFPTSNKACLNSDFAKQECDSGTISSTTSVPQVKAKTLKHVKTNFANHRCVANRRLGNDRQKNKRTVDCSRRSRRRRRRRRRLHLQHRPTSPPTTTTTAAVAKVRTNR